MDLKEIKKLTAYARKAGVKSLKINGLELELHDVAPNYKPTTKKPGKLLELDNTVPAPTKDPTLAEINDWIYKEEAV